MKHLHHWTFLFPTIVTGTLLLNSCSPNRHLEFSTIEQKATLQVPADYQTIQAAIDAATPGDTIQVAPGNYTEQITVMDKSVKIIGDSAQYPRLLGHVYFFNADFSELRNFEVVGPSSFSSGVRAYASSVLIDHVSISGFDTGLSVSVQGTGNNIISATVISGCGQGFAVEDGASATFQNCLSLFNSSKGFFVASDSTAHVTNIDAVGNGAYESQDAGFHCEGSCALTNSIFVNNDVGIYCNGSCQADNNLVWGNWTNYYGLDAGSHDINLDPQFTNATEYDFHLKEASPAIDTGSFDSAPSIDFDGIPRPQGESIDMGAFEYRKQSSDITLAINEVMANPLDEDTGEFIELYNYGTQAIDAAGLVLSDGDAVDVIKGYQDGSTIIPANGYAVILDPEYANDYTLVEGARLLTVANTTLGNGLSTSDPVSLWESNMVTPIDRFSFPTNPGNGISIEKVSIEEGDVLSNWKPSPCGYTPGAENCASQPGNVSRDVLIAINEVMANPLDESTGEFVELYNFGDESVDVSGFILSDGDSNDTIIGWQSGSTLLLPGDYGLILDPDYQGQYTIPGSTVLLTIESTSTLGNGLAVTDPITLLNATGQSVIDSFSRPFNPGNGISVEKLDPAIGDIPSNWAPSPCAQGSSPGFINCASAEVPVSGNTIAITEVMANPLTEDTGEYVELFNYGTSPVDLLGWRLDDGDAMDTLEGFEGGSTILQAGGWALVLDREYAGDYQLPGGALLLTTDDTTIGSGLSTLDPIILRSASESAVVDSFSFPFNPGNGISIEKADLVVGDVAQNWVASPCNLSPGTINCAMSGEDSGDVTSTFIVISEVMANPVNEGTGEFIELFNAGPDSENISNWMISDGDAMDTIISYQGGSTVIEPGQYAVVVDQDFANDYIISSDALVLTVDGATIGNGLSTNDPITLYKADASTIVDTFSFPTNPGNGVSIEKRTLTAGDEQANWTRSTCLTGTGAANDYSSPGYRNCADWGNGITGDGVMGEPCPYGSIDCLSGICLLDLYSLESYCSEDCSGSGNCTDGFSCLSIDDLFATGITQACVKN